MLLTGIGSQCQTGHRVCACWTGTLRLFTLAKRNPRPTRRGVGSWPWCCFTVPYQGSCTQAQTVLRNPCSDRGTHPYGSLP